MSPFFIYTQGRPHIILSSTSFYQKISSDKIVAKIYNFSVYYSTFILLFNPYLIFLVCAMKLGLYFPDHGQFPIIIARSCVVARSWQFPIIIAQSCVVARSWAISNHRRPIMAISNHHCPGFTPWAGVCRTFGAGRGWCLFLLAVFFNDLFFLLSPIYIQSFGFQIIFMQMIIFHLE